MNAPKLLYQIWTINVAIDFEIYIPDVSWWFKNKNKNFEFEFEAERLSSLSTIVVLN
jgi:hypothetical protein